MTIVDMRVSHCVFFMIKSLSDSRICSVLFSAVRSWSGMITGQITTDSEDRVWHIVGQADSNS